MPENSNSRQYINTPDEASLKYMFKLSAPMIVTTVSFTIMQFIDRFMVSRLGTEALAAILPASIVSFVPGSFAIGVSGSVTTFVSQSLGRGEREDCSSYCWQSIYMGLFFYVLVISVMWPTAPWIFNALGHEPAIVDMEVTYLRIILYAQVVAVVVWSCSQFFMGIHRPIITMYAALAAQIVNVTFNYVLIFGRLGFPAMGIAGAGWGTFIGVTVGAVIRLIVFLSGDVNRTFKGRHTLRIEIGKMLDIVKVGLPLGFELMLNVALWGVVLIALVGRFGKEALAANNAVLACSNLSVMPAVGLARALSAAVGRSIGRARKDVAVRQTRLALKIALFYMCSVGICFLVFRNAIMHFWSSDDKVIEIGMLIMIFAAIQQVFHASRIIYGGSLRGAGDTVWLAMVSVVASLVVLGAGGYGLVHFFPGLGAVGAWIAATASIAVVGLANRWRFNSNIWMRIDLFGRRPPGIPAEGETTVEQ